MDKDNYKVKESCLKVGLFVGSQNRNKEVLQYSASELHCNFQTSLLQMSIH